ncbi:hypothetical protein [Fructobacillus evanidus]|uniref:Uncharacterized protein n=1 Tax=Fructobacillus evanidus TaxID=3064281 RepID=A0ABM9MX25_9LACO|nr:unnamed protein product [Fructobacillus sp. LMG 32999]CAK1229926.1 unnamed protein product [Fructobacillus sp. LMG 32999]CAK1230724.1 unnamed protein product [Fructobacillus sp. LMG 32999]CAK1230781.1 unnamed protein product [Fructobacillus sp. LMG 32999]CAK1231917.1 unnamed protein product [Fructobacillus sp. LMG 32999]
MKKTSLTVVLNIMKKLIKYWWRWSQRCSFGIVCFLFLGNLQTAFIVKNQGAQTTNLPSEQLGNLYTLFSWLLLTGLLWLPLFIAIIELLLNSKSKKIR